jgi:hypothetical protein
MEIVLIVLDTLAAVVASILFFVGSIFPGLAPKVTPTLLDPTTQTTSVSSTTAAFPSGTQKPATTMAATSSPAQKPAATVAVPTAPVVTIPTKTQEEVNELARAALINILCLPQTGLSGISGSGVIVDSRGVILTNAHIGQYFLLRNYLTAGNVTCTIRVGSPAEERYTATLLYLPPAWVAANASQLKSTKALGTGEHDYAFLLITGRTLPGAALPESFPRLHMDRGYVDVGDPMLLAAYPAGFLSGEIIQKSLYAGSAVAYVTQLFSFSGDKKVDLFSVGGTVISQSGSSGGAAVRLRDGKLAGIFVTSSSAASTGERDLRAVSLGHIDDSLKAQNQGGLAELLTGSLAAKAAEFNAKVAPGLTAALETVLKSN